MRRSNGNGAANFLACALGWFSIGLGAAELLAPRRLGSALGMDGREHLLQAYGLREVAAGVAILTANDRAPWVWGRVAGDALDLATLAPALGHRDARRGVVVAAIGAVAAVTLLDILCARQMSRPRPVRGPVRDYSDRSGFPQGPEKMRGIAATVH